MMEHPCPLYMQKLSLLTEALRSIGEIPADQEPILKEVLEAIREFRVADIFIPAGSQVLRFHTRQVLRPLGGDPRSYEVEFFAPLVGFVLASGRERLTLSAWRRTLGRRSGLPTSEQIREVPNGFLSHALQLHA
jgi:hypothetical protein